MFQLFSKMLISLTMSKFHYISINICATFKVSNFIAVSLPVFFPSPNLGILIIKIVILNPVFDCISFSTTFVYGTNGYRAHITNMCKYFVLLVPHKHMTKKNNFFILLSLLFNPVAKFYITIRQSWICIFFIIQRYT